MQRDRIPRVGYFEEEVFTDLFSPEEFFEEEDPDYALEKVNAVSSISMFEPLDMQTKD